jgi:flagellar motor protein MotB
VDNTEPVPLLERKLDKSGALELPLVLMPLVADSSPVARWEFRIVDRNGRDFFVKQGTGRLPSVFEWDGYSMDKKLVEKGGRYLYSLKVTDAAGNSGITETDEFLYVPAKKKVVMTFYSDALFEEGKAGVKTSAYKALKTVKNELKKYPGAEMVIFGHTDNKEPVGGYNTRIRLSKARANAVKYYLENLLGVKKGIILTQGLGDSLPVSTENTDEARGKNRRVEVIIQGTVLK